MAKKRNTLDDLLRDVMQLIRERSADVSFDETTTMMWCAAFLNSENGPVTAYDRGVAMLRLGALLGTKNTNRLRKLNEKRRSAAQYLGSANKMTSIERAEKAAKWQAEIEDMIRKNPDAKYTVITDRIGRRCVGENGKTVSGRTVRRYCYDPRRKK